MHWESTTLRQVKLLNKKNTHLVSVFVSLATGNEFNSQRGIGKVDFLVELLFSKNMGNQIFAIHLTLISVIYKYIIIWDYTSTAIKWPVYRISLNIWNVIIDFLLCYIRGKLLSYVLHNGDLLVWKTRSLDSCRISYQKFPALLSRYALIPLGQTSERIMGI